ELLGPRPSFRHQRRRRHGVGHTPHNVWLGLVPVALMAACGSRAPDAPWGVPQASPPGTDACQSQPVGPSAPRVWRLTHAQLKNTLVDVFGNAGTSIDSYPADSRPDVTEYANAADSLVVASLLASYYSQTAAEVSADVANRSSQFLGCAIP